MAVSFNSILAEVLSQLNALDGTTAANAETAYTNATGGTIASLSTDWSVSQAKDAILDKELDLIEAICRTEHHPERADFALTSSTFASGATLPTQSSGGVPFLGKFSGVIDNTTGKALIETPLRKVQFITDNENSSLPVRPLVYALDGQKIYYYAPNSAAIIAPGIARATWTGNIRCKDHHRDALVAGALMQLLPKEGAWPDAWELNAKLWAGHLAEIASYDRATVAIQPEKA